MKKRGARIYNYTSLNSFYRILSSITSLFILLGFRNKKIVILQIVLLKYIFPFALFRFIWYRNFVKTVLSFISKRNMLYIEVNDLIYEQSVDLGIDVSPLAIIYQEFIFNQPNLHFIFASQLMGEYAVEKYGLKADSFQTIINGAPEIDLSTQCPIEIIDDNKVKYIYAGTLNAGREIKQFIEIFVENKNTTLILIGTEGEWISDLKYDNIHYLGGFPEKEALIIASKCDVGIIPYNEEKLYYNICYPTKNSFYVAAGLPILCTPLQETMRVFNQYPQIAFFEKIVNWSTFLKTTTKEDILIAKESVKNVKDKFFWKTLLNKMNLNS
ncbi:glycosyltransferase family 4 protein [Chryseobacterium limigenitum]